MGAPRDKSPLLCYKRSIVQQFYSIIYSPPNRAALGNTVEANNADDACRKVAASILDLGLPAVD